MSRFKGAVHTSVTEPWHTIYAAAVGAHTKKPIRFGRTTPFLLDRLLGSILAHDSDGLASRSQLEKLSNTFDSVPLFRALRRFLQTLYVSDPPSLFKFSLVALNSPALGPEDLALTALRKREAVELRLAASQGACAQVWAAKVNGGKVRSEAIVWSTRLACSLNLLDRDQPAEACEILVHLVDVAKSMPLHHLAASALLASHTALGNRTGTISLIAREAAQDDLTLALLPIANALRQLQWADYKSLADSLIASVALSALWRSTEDDAVATMLRYSFSYQLRRSGCKRPSELADDTERFDPLLLIYYMRHICVPNIMDMSRAFKSSREVSEERQKVCASLKVIDPDNSDRYDAEIYSIANALVLQDGLQLVDRSRIHVDTDAVSRWGRRVLAEDFDRYVDLAIAGIGTDSNFDALIRDLFGTAGSRQVYYTPDDQADAILLDILIRIRDVFLSNSDYGLDYFLSKRVRHQSFVGLVRGPLEFKNMITTRDFEFGSYRDNEFWLSRFTVYGEQRIALSVVFTKFGEHFDDAISTFRDRYFHIYTPETPDGLFDIILTPRMLFVFRSLIVLKYSFGEFLRLVFLLFWGTLEPSLTEARRVISTNLKNQLSDLFSNLRDEVRALAENDLAFPEFTATVGDVSAEVQRSLDQASRWFVKPEGEQAARNFTLMQSVEIAVNSARISHKAFDPDLSLNVTGTCYLNAPDLLLITDTIFIALDNIKQHSGIRVRPRVVIKCTEGVGNDDLMRLEVVSAVARSRISETEEKLANIRNIISKGDVEKRVRREGGSGLLKLASSVRQSPDGQLEFGLTEFGEFRLAICFRPTKYIVAVIAE